MSEPQHPESEHPHLHPHPIETAKELAHEAELGRSARTPLIALTGITLFVAVVVLVLLTVTFLVYFLA